MLAQIAGGVVPGNGRIGPVGSSADGSGELVAVAQHLHPLQRDQAAAHHRRDRRHEAPDPRFRPTISTTTGRSSERRRICAVCNRLERLNPMGPDCGSDPWLAHLPHAHIVRAACIAATGVTTTGLLTNPARSSSYARRGWSPPSTAERLMTPAARVSGGSPREGWPAARRAFFLSASVSVMKSTASAPAAGW